MLRCTTDELFFYVKFYCCDSVVAHFKHATTRQPIVLQAQASCGNLRRQHREATVAGIGLGTTSRRRNSTVETCVDNTTKLRPQASVLAPR
jgi:hypothetical protein